MAKSEENIKYIVRVANTDLDGKRALKVGITKIKGVGVMFANALCVLAGVDKDKKIGLLTDDEIGKIEKVLKDPVAEGFPSWMLNHQREYETGDNKHLVTANLIFTVDNDIKRLRKIKCYRGIRHSSGLPVRGQRTKSNFRKNKGKLTGGNKKKGRV